MISAVLTKPCQLTRVDWPVGGVEASADAERRCNKDRGRMR